MITPFAGIMHEVQPSDESSEAVSRLGFATTPTNQQIIDAAKAAYTEYQPAVDAMTIALVNTIKDTSMANAIARLDGTNWSSPGISSSVVDPFFADSNVQTALGVARKSNHTTKSLSVAIFTKTLPTNGPGVIGFASDIAGAGRTGLILQLDIFQLIVDVDNTSNLQYGLWLPAPTELHDMVVGFYVNTTLQGVDVNLKILLTKTLQPYGYVASSGAYVPMMSGVFAGATAQRQAS